MVWLLSAPAFAGDVKANGSAYPLKYEGGSLPLKPNHALKAVVANGEVVFMQHDRRFAVPVDSITEIAFGTHVYRRFGAAILGLVPLVDLDKVEDHYVGVTWTDNTRRAGRTDTLGVLFKLNSAEYRDFVAALERSTGKKAVDTSKTPTVARYDL